MITRIRTAAVAILASSLALSGAGLALATAAPQQVGVRVPAAPTTVVAKYGDATVKVLDVQNKLIRLGYLPETGNTGKFDAATLAAVKAFQTGYKLPVTGVVTEADFYRLWSKTQITSPIVAKHGDRTNKTLDIQIRLIKLGYLKVGDHTGQFDATTGAGVRKFQRAYKRLITGMMTEADFYLLWTKTRDSKVQVSLIRAMAGDSGAKVTDIQNRLIKLGYLASDANTGNFGPQTLAAVRAFQTGYRRVVTGKLLESDYAVLVTKSNAYTPKFDSRCLGTGRAMCVDRKQRKLFYVVNGKLVATYDVRTGRPGMTTRPGVFKVYYKNANHMSSLYEVRMPYSMFFDGGEAVHYSADFAANGYGVGSHGCVNMRDWKGIVWLFGQVKLGDKVVVY